MTKRTGFLLGGGVVVGVLGWLWLGHSRRGNQVPEIHVTGEDLDYQNLSSEDLSASHLVDLNDSKPDQLRNLSLTAESLERLVENRPYRSKLELVSRMVLSEAEYETIKDRVGVADGREPVKIA